MPAGADNRPQPQLRKAPRWPFWTDTLRPWLRRRARHHSDQLTDRLGGPPRRRVIVLLGLVLALSAADSSSVGAIAPQLQPALGIGTAELGLLVTVSSLVGALAAIPFGVLVDKTRRVNVLAASIVLWGVAEAVSGFSTSFEMLLLTRLLLGAVTATAVPAVASLTGDFFPAGSAAGSTATSSPARWSAPASASACPRSSPPPSAGGRRSSCSPCRASLSPGRCGRGCRSPPAAGRAGWSRERRGSCRSKRPAGAARRSPHAGEEAVRTDDAVLVEVRKRGVRARRGHRRGRRPRDDVALAGRPLRAARAHQPVHHRRLLARLPVPRRAADVRACSSPAGTSTSGRRWRRCSSGSSARGRSSAC